MTIPVVASVALGKRSSTYTTREASAALVNAALESLGISRYQAALLLQVKPSNHIFALTTGRRRPGGLLLTRLSWLLIFHQQGIQVNGMQSIDWSTGVVTWRADYPEGHSGPVY